MSKADQTTQDYHAAIKNVVEHLKSKRNELQSEITNDELEKAKISGEVNKLQDRLSILNANIRKKSEFRREYDKAISQSEEHFVQLLQKSEDFLSLTRREAMALSTAISEPSVCPEKVPPEEAKQKEAKQKEVKQKEAKQKEPQCKESPNGPPPAVFLVKPGNSEECSGCSNAYTCATVMVPYRANGL